MFLLINSSVGLKEDKLNRLSINILESLHKIPTMCTFLSVNSLQVVKTPKLTKKKKTEDMTSVSSL